jgi:hypothetical protein
MKLAPAMGVVLLKRQEVGSSRAFFLATLVVGVSVVPARADAIDGDW